MAGKRAYQKKIEAQLKEWSKTIHQWAEMVDHAETKVKRAAARQLKDLQAKEAALTKKLEELKKVSEGSWTDVKGGVEKAGTDVKSAFDSLKHALGKAILRFK